MAVEAQQPPGAGGEQPAAGVIDDDRALARDPGAPHGGPEVGVGGQRVTPAWPGRSRQLGIEIDEGGARNVPAHVGIGLWTG